MNQHIENQDIYHKNNIDQDVQHNLLNLVYCNDQLEIMMVYHQFQNHATHEVSLNDEEMYLMMQPVENKLQFL